MSLIERVYIPVCLPIAALHAYPLKRCKILRSTHFIAGAHMIVRLSLISLSGLIWAFILAGCANTELSPSAAGLNSDVKKLTDIELMSAYGDLAREAYREGETQAKIESFLRLEEEAEYRGLIDNKSLGEINRGILYVGMPMAQAFASFPVEVNFKTIGRRNNYRDLSNPVKLLSGLEFDTVEYYSVSRFVPSLLREEDRQPCNSDYRGSARPYMLFHSGQLVGFRVDGVVHEDDYNTVAAGLARYQTNFSRVDCRRVEELRTSVYAFNRRNVGWKTVGARKSQFGLGSK